MKNDHQLIREFQAGHTQAFDELVRRHLPDVYRFFYRLTGDDMEAEDLAQDVFLKLYQALPRFRFESAFKTYLYRINTNQAYSHFRKKRWRTLLHLDQIVEPSHSGDDPVDIRQDLWKAMARLPKQQQRIVMLRLSQELPFKDIAGILGITENNAKVNYHHGIQKLKT
ncbi:MAG: sigma-70 family RNA polymerase sigma factor, partial [Candidatus Neomarinimicrobiota bacterium]